jgi:hypothetical protein
MLNGGAGGYEAAGPYQRLSMRVRKFRLPERVRNPDLILCTSPG